ncbi:hypothetical protein TNCV_4905951 [Trichonephila clavipes]|uniref:Uncharacterized protein n=1 Tax=Trichonephila clavipes TaxID=2585209 RepID=A0A8X6RSA4_TRICX|nr:hypothetical protein TNCV_4905951 [Trichonephila clavipes]
MAMRKVTYVELIESSDKIQERNSPKCNNIVGFVSIKALMCHWNIRDWDGVRLATQPVEAKPTLITTYYQRCFHNCWSHSPWNPTDRSRIIFSDMVRFRLVTSVGSMDVWKYQLLRACMCSTGKVPWEHAALENVGNA